MKFWEFSFTDLFKLLKTDIVIWDKVNSKIVLVFCTDEWEFYILQENQYCNKAGLSKQDIIDECLVYNLDGTVHSNSFIAETEFYGLKGLEH